MFLLLSDASSLLLSGTVRCQMETATSGRILHKPDFFFIYVLIKRNFGKSICLKNSAPCSSCFSGSLSIVGGLIIGDIAVSLNWATWWKCYLCPSHCRTSVALSMQRESVTPSASIMWLSIISINDRCFQAGVLSAVDSGPGFP